MVGQTLGHYRIEAKLGEGGMGVVYKARDTDLDRPVAIKVLPAERVEDGGRKRRFVQEAKAASALNHPNIVHIYGIDTAGSVDFIAMEYVEGRTLADLIGRKGLKTGETLRYAVQVADALATAHAARIVHRDIKPSNVMVTPTGLVKVLDFGLAKLVERGDADLSASTQTMLPRTEEGAVIGTAEYMSPEQAEGRTLDGRSDIFSFGSVLYEMATGRRPFNGESKLSVLSRILREDPTPPRQISTSTPPELERIILRCLRKDPARRYQTMADVKIALEDLETETKSGSQSQLPAGTTAWRGRWAWPLMPAALLAVAVFIWQTWRSPPAEPLRAIPLTTFPGVESYPSLSPDGNFVAFTWTGPNQDNPDIYVQQIGAGPAAQRTTDPRNDFNPVWSPDGRWIGFLRRESQSGMAELRLIPPLGGPERKVAEIHPRGSEPSVIPPYLAWCPDSTCLFVTDSPGEGKPDALFVIAIDTGEKRQVTYPQPPVNGDSNPAISRDGRSLLFYRNINSASGELLWLRLTKALTPEGEPKRLPSAGLRDRYPAWMPNGKEILFSAKSSLWRVSVPGETPPGRLAFVGDDGLMPIVESLKTGANRLVYLRSFDDSNIWRIDTPAPGMPAEAPPKRAISSTRSEYTPKFSPDGRRVAFSSNRSGEMEIWSSDIDGGNAAPLTSLGASSLRPHWSPDGNTIVFDSNVQGQIDVYSIPASGGKPRRLTTDPTNEQVPSFSQDGEWIYFASNRTGRSQIWKAPRDGGGKAIPVTSNTGVHAYEHGSSLYYTQTTSVEASPLWRLPLSGGQPVILIDGVVLRSFAVFDKGIYYFDRPANEVRLRFFDFATAKSTTIAQNLGNVTSGMTVSPDGRTILYCRIDFSVDDLMLVENFR